MSLDVLQNKTGQIILTPSNTSGGYPGGVQLSKNVTFAEGAATGAGGALCLAPTVAPTGTPTSIDTAGTISHNGHGVAIVANSSAADKTGVIVQAGTYHGQQLIVINTTAANTITMATAATSNVANGTSCVISALAAVLLCWSAISSRWYQVRAA